MVLLHNATQHNALAAVGSEMWWTGTAHGARVHTTTLAQTTQTDTISHQVVGERCTQRYDVHHHSECKEDSQGGGARALNATHTAQHNTKHSRQVKHARGGRCKRGGRVVRSRGGNHGVASQHKQTRFRTEWLLSAARNATMSTTTQSAKRTLKVVEREPLKPQLHTHFSAMWQASAVLSTRMVAATHTAQHNTTNSRP